jgi:hypothetical protein
MPSITHTAPLGSMPSAAKICVENNTQSNMMYRNTIFIIVSITRYRLKVYVNNGYALLSLADNKSPMLIG